MIKRGENIYKRKDGRWEGRYKTGIKPDGKTKYSSVYGRSYSDVKALSEILGHSSVEITVNTRYGHTHPVQPYSITKHGSEPLNNADRSLFIQNTITVILL